MGWTYTTMPREGPKAYFDRLLTSDTEKLERRVLRSAFYGRFEYYAAVEEVAKEDVYVYDAYVNGEPLGEKKLLYPKGHREVWCAVIMIRYTPRAKDGFTFGYKDMTDSCGPVIRNCPGSILDLLTPIEGDLALLERLDGPRWWAYRWREDCRERITQTRRIAEWKRKLKPGDKIVLKKGCRPQEVTFVRLSGRTPFGRADGVVYRIRDASIDHIEVTA